MDCVAFCARVPRVFKEIKAYKNLAFWQAKELSARWGGLRYAIGVVDLMTGLGTLSMSGLAQRNQAQQSNRIHYQYTHPFNNHDTMIP